MTLTSHNAEWLRANLSSFKLNKMLGQLCEPLGIDGASAYEPRHAQRGLCMM